jgi:hypothetical protein
MNQIRDMSQLELAAFVQAALRQADVDVVLSGGAAVSFYTDGQYVSQDLDLIDRYANRSRQIPKIMSALGFSERGRYFIHPDTEYFIEFPTGPLSVGQEPVKDVDVVALATGDLHIISATDCVKDRLLAYFYWDDRQSLHQALQVARQVNIDFSELERWGAVEGHSEKLNKYKLLLFDD